MKIYKISNKYIILLLAVTMMVSSCELFKPARDSDKEKVYTDDDLGELQGTRVFDPETGEWRTMREVTGKVDTVQWTDLSEKDYPPIKSDGFWNGNENPDVGTTTPGGAYNVSLILPFLANQSSFGEIDDNSKWAINFYGGAKIAYDDLKNDGVNFNVNVSDSEGTTGKVNRLLQGGPAVNADLIIGPYKRNNVRLVESFSKQQKTPFVVPFTAQLGMAQGNPNYIQMNPSLESHCRGITRHARSSYEAENIVLVAQDLPEEQARFDYFQRENERLTGTIGGPRFKELLIGRGDENQINIDITPFISQGETSIFIVPSWASESFVYSLLRVLMIEQAKGEEIVVYGMPMWMDFDQIDYEFYQKLNVHVSSSSYIDNDDEKVRQFKNKFFQLYGAIPNEEAYLGYDAMLYFGKMLNQHGRLFPQSIDRQPFDVLHGRFEFERVVLEPEKHKEDLNYFDQLENTFVHILQFQDFQFQPVR